MRDNVAASNATDNVATDTYQSLHHVRNVEKQFLTGRSKITKRGITPRNTSTVTPNKNVIDLTIDTQIDTDTSFMSLLSKEGNDWKGIVTTDKSKDKVIVSREILEQITENSICRECVHNKESGLVDDVFSRISVLVKNSATSRKDKKELEK